MMRLLAALLAALLFAGLASPSAATNGNRLRLIYVAPPSPLPATQTINFGVKTLVGFGGAPMGYASPQFLGITRWLGITQQIDKDGAAVTIFQVDDRNMLVPKNGAGAYGTAWSGPANGPYSVTVGEYFDAALTQPTGAATVISVPIVTGAAHAREMTSAANGCLLNCETVNANKDGCSNPASACSTFSAFKNQMNTLLAAGTAIVKGDTIYMRDAGPGPDGTGPYGEFNPHNQAYRIRPPVCTTTQWTCAGAGRVTITSETVDSAPSANGNPIRNQNGFQYGGGISIDTTSTGDIAFALDFTHLWCYVNFATTSCLAYTGSSAGSGVGFSYNRQEAGPLVAAGTAGVTGFNAHANSTFDHNYNYRMGKGFKSVGGATATFNICERNINDFIDIGKGGNTVTDNFCFNWAGISPNHSDLIQRIGVNDNQTYTDFAIARNITVQGVAALDQGDPPQCLFLRTVATNHETVSGAVIENNFCNTQSQNGIYLSFFDNPTVRFNLGFNQLNTLAAFPAKLLVGTNEAGTGGTFANNTFNGFGIAGQLPVVTQANEVSLANTTLAYGIAMPGCTQGANPGWTTRAAVIAACKPANVAVASGGLVNVDGTVSHPWFPVNDTGQVCWNNGAVFDHTKTCAQMGTTPAT